MSPIRFQQKILNIHHLHFRLKFSPLATHKSRSNNGKYYIYATCKIVRKFHGRMISSIVLSSNGCNAIALVGCCVWCSSSWCLKIVRCSRCETTSNQSPGHFSYNTVKILTWGLCLFSICLGESIWRNFYRFAIFIFSQKVTNILPYFRLINSLLS